VKMSVRELAGLSKEEWESLDPSMKDKITAGQAKLSALQQTKTIEMLEDDQDDIRRRECHTFKSLFPDAQCDNGEEMRITVLGDVNGTEALQLLNMSSQPQPSQPAPSQPAPQQRPSKVKWWVPLLAGALVAGPTAALATYLLTDRPSFDADLDPGNISLRDSEWIPETKDEYP
jgi:hypothetical protein